MAGCHFYLRIAALVLVLASSVSAQSTGEQKLTPTERDAIRQLIREELKAEQAAKATQAEKDGQGWSEVGKKLDLEGFFTNGFRWNTEDRAFAFHVGGRLEWDNAWFTQTDNLLIGPSAGTRYQDGTAMRRARMRADGTAWEQIDFVCEVNFANIQDVGNVNSDSVQVGSVGLTDFYLTFRDVFRLGNLRLGHFIAPYGLERFTTANYLPYMERSSLFDAFWGPNQRQSGVMFFDSYFDDRLTAHAAFTRVGRADLNNFAFTAEDGRYAGGLRFTGLPVYRDDGRFLLHLGANYYHQALAGNNFAVANRLPLRAGAGSVQVPNLLATGTYLSHQGASIADLEGAALFGPLSLSAEYAVGWTGEVFKSFDGRTNSEPRGRATYHAFYVEAGCFLTPGDRRRYDRKHGTWDRTVPLENAFGVAGEDGRWCWGRGAVEVLARLSFLDLVSGSPTLTPTSPSDGARAGRQRDLTLGANWYLNPQTRLMFNYVWTHVDSVVAGASGDVHAIGTRLHFDF